MKGKILIIAVVLLVLGLLLHPPVSGGKFSSPWGIRPGGLDGWFHTGSDIAHAVGTQVTPVAPGKISHVNNNPEDPRGLSVNISHLGFIQTRYYHLNSIDMAAGETVNHKSVIGTLGNTGLSTGPHIHYEIRLLGIPLPAYLLTLPARIFQQAAKGLKKSGGNSNPSF